jgi:nicotinamide mononucleotide adenylyltransferase
MNTIAELEYLRDIGFPFLLQRLNRWEVLLSVYSERNEENRRQAKDFLFGVANSRKVRRGSLAGLLDPEFMKPKLAQEKKLRAFAAESKDEKLKEALKAWDKVAAAQKVRAGNIKRHTVLEQAAGFNSDLFAIARTLVRAAEEKPKPNPERLREFGDANLKALEVQLFSPEEIYPEYEAHKLADGLAFLCEVLGTKNPLVQKVLAGKSPQERAAQLVKGTTLAKVDERKKLYEGGKKAVDASKDPMILLAKMVDKDSRDVRKLIETQIDEVSRQAYAQIARVLYAMEGDKIYPDATFTLRLAFGAVKGYEENGKQVPFETTFAGLYEHSAEHGNKGVYELPERWLQRKDKLDLKVPFNFVLTADIIGGNSGSPVINKNAEIVGIIFDGNIHSLVSDFAYTEKQSRAVAVHSRGITEALAKVYDAKELVAELTENGKSAD